jgi:2-hydroxychromene-2-carboxylate isomerase
VTARDRLKRRVFPRAVVALSTVDAPRRGAAVARRALGGAGTVRLFVAFDDPYSAVALIGLSDRLAGRRAQLIVEPVVKRGIPGDPAVEDKRRYALVDARRLARRDGLELSRSKIVAAEATAFLAGWAAAAPAAERTAFCVAAMRELWFESDGPVLAEPFAARWRAHVGGDPPPATAPGALSSERAMRMRRLYDTPVAVIGGQWFFAHERLPQIEARLDDLGWRAAA